MCHGNGPDHCCSLGEYGVCVFLEEGTVPGRRWACQLRRELGSWEQVHKDDRYRRKIKPLLTDIGVNVDCGDWPQQVPSVMNNPAMGKCCYDGGDP